MEDKVKLIIFSGIPTLLAYIGVSTSAFYLLCSLFVLDVITGLIKSIYTKTTESKKGGKGIAIKVSMIILILGLGIFLKIGASVLDIIDFDKIWSIMNGFILLLGFVELFSINQNIYVSITKKEVKEIDAFMILVDNIYNVFSFLFKTLMEYGERVAKTFINSKLK